MDQKQLTITIEKGMQYLIGTVNELPGCHTQGKNMQELFENLQEAIALYFEVEESRKELAFRSFFYVFFGVLFWPGVLFS